MAELAIMAFAAASSAVTAVGTAAGTAVAGMSAASVLQGAATIGSVLMGVMEARSTMAAGRAAARDARFDQKVTDLEMDREATASGQRADDLRRQALQRTAEARVVFGASGLDMSSRQLDAIEGSLDNDLTFGLALEKSNLEIARAASGVKKSQLNLQAKNAMSTARSSAAVSYLDAFATGAKGVAGIVNRGGPTSTAKV